MAKKQASAPDALITAFEVLAEQGWRRLSMVEVATRTGLSLPEVRAWWPGRGALLRALNRRVDEAMLSFDAADLVGLPARDRVFDLLMRRLEALQPFRPGLTRLARDARCEPCLLLLGACRLDRSLAWLQDAAGLPRHGLRARLARRALAVAHLQTIRVWLHDEADDMGRTMAELDKQLRRLETIASLIRTRGKSQPNDAAPAAA
jgi:AcrR family transcriptional regulator